MELQTEEVFTPNGFPTYTYVTRLDNELEERLALALKMAGFVSVAGPSKSGKTVLIEKVVGPDKLITVAGGTVNSSDSLWAQLIARLGGPQTTTRGTNSTQGEKLNVGMKAGVGISKTGGEVSGGLGLENALGTSEAQTFIHSGVEHACKLLREQGLTLLVDDFHYIQKDVQLDLAKQFKEITRTTPRLQRVQIVLAAVPHRADDPFRANADLNGRIGTVDLEYWSSNDLEKIANMGLSALNITLPSILIQKLAVQAAGSPQLMQILCFTLVESVLKIRCTSKTPQSFAPKDREIESVLKFAASMNDSRSLVGKLDEGKKTRGKERVAIYFKDGTEGDIYTCILRALAIDPPTLDFGELELQARIVSICSFSPPPWHSVVQTLARMQEIAKSQNSNAFVWDNEQLSLTDPHVLFYLRWCGEYRRPEMRILDSVPLRRNPSKNLK